MCVFLICCLCFGERFEVRFFFFFFFFFLLFFACLLFLVLLGFDLGGLAGDARVARLPEGVVVSDTGVGDAGGADDGDLHGSAVHWGCSCAGTKPPFTRAS